ncbi:MAG: response regulator [Oscillatoria sp. PMC 1051.18]|nr:response regulator [Oscillatoria sp. PMC 1050.18]MEC5030939.1 response regulator [Oscillatoria sp. PMC 1051.18]
MSKESLVPHQGFIFQLNAYAQKQFTGRLDIQMVTGQKYSLYLSFGHLVWATGGIHPVRRWRRQLVKNCPTINLKRLRLPENEQWECWDYYLLMLLAKREKLNYQAIVAVIQGIVEEVLFDIFQTMQLTQNLLAVVRKEEITEVFNFLANPENQLETFEISFYAGLRPSAEGILPPRWMLDVDAALRQTDQTWQQWQLAGLRDLLPDLAPVVKQTQQLKKQISAETSKNMMQLLDGKRSLRDLAVLLKQDLVSFCQALLPNLYSADLTLVKISDLVSLNLARVGAKKSNQGAIVACIDDNAEICRSVEAIVTEFGFRFLGIQETLQTIPLLVKNKPDLIFLDLVMPIANGYEICAQIRRVESLRDIPVVILTACDGIIDRLRAKMVGASGFLSKPVNAEKLLSELEKHGLKV